METHHLHTIQQLQLELSEARERSVVYTDESHISHANAKDVSPFGQNKGSQLNGNEVGVLNNNPVALSNGNVDNALSFVTAGNASTKVGLQVNIMLKMLFDLFCT